MTTIVNIAEKLRRDAETELENILCKKTGATRAMLVIGEHDGLIFALRAAGVNYGDTVICPAFGDPVLLGAVQQTGATAVFCDVTSDTWTLDSMYLENMLKCYITDKKNLPKAVIASCAFGLPCDFVAIKALCERFGIIMIEDIRHSFDAAIGSKSCGTFGDVSVALISKVPEVSAVFCDYAMQNLHAERAEDLLPSIVDISISLHRLTNMKAECEKRQKAAKIYGECLGNYFQLQYIPADFFHTYSGFGVVLKNETDCKHAKEQLELCGLSSVETQPFLLHRLAGRMPALTKMPNAEQLSCRLFTLPIHAWLNKKTISQIARAVII